MKDKWIVKWPNDRTEGGRYLVGYGSVNERASWSHRQKHALRFSSITAALTVVSVWHFMRSGPRVVRLIPKVPR